MSQKNQKLSNKSPLRYPGGKSRACKIIENVCLEYMPFFKNYECVVSPFFGGGSFEFYLQNKYGFDIIANDKFTPLYNFWKSCKENNDELCTKLAKNLNNIDKEIFHKLRECIMDQEGVEQAISYFIINRCSFSGATLSGGFSQESSTKRFTKSSIERVEKLNLKKFRMENLDFEEFLQNEAKDDNNKKLIFLDPPYFLEKKSTLYGNNGDLHEHFNHEKLFKSISGMKNWILTYNNCEYIKNLYKNHVIIEVDWSYSMNKSKESSEIIILSN